MSDLFKIPFFGKETGKSNAEFYEKLFTKLRQLYDLQEELKTGAYVYLDVTVGKKFTSLSRRTSITLNDSEAEEFNELITKFICKYEALKTR